MALQARSGAQTNELVYSALIKSREKSLAVKTFHGEERKDHYTASENDRHPGLSLKFPPIT